MRNYKVGKSFGLSITIHKKKDFIDRAYQYQQDQGMPIQLTQLVSSSNFIESNINTVTLFKIKENGN